MEGGQIVFHPFLGSGPEGVNDLCFHTYGEFSPSSPSSMSPPPQIPVSRPKFLPQGIWEEEEEEEKISHV